MASSEPYESMIQELTFDHAGKIVDGRLGRGSFKKLKLCDDGGKYNNFALLISDQCPWGFTLLSNHYGELYRSRGSILKQIDEIMRIVDTINPRLRMKGRTGFIRRFPRGAVEEGVLNAAIHFDISQMRDIIIDVNNERLVIISPGGMIDPIKWNAKTTTCPRNQQLAELLMNMGRVNLKLYGMRSIKDSYQRTGQMPLMKYRKDLFMTFCPSVAEEMRKPEVLDRKISDILSKHPGTTLARLSEHMLLSPTVALRAVTRLESEDIVFEMGASNSRRFYLNAVKKPIQTPYDDRKRTDNGNSDVDEGK